jgi:ADP-heptose:LPS heptosyltransferase
LVVRTDKLGDFITALPAIYALKNHNTKPRVVVCVAPLNEALARSCSFIDDVIVDDNRSIFLLIKKIKYQNIDISVTMFSNTRLALAQLLAMIGTRIAPATKIAQIFYNKRVMQKRSRVEMSEYEYNLALTYEVFKDIKPNYPKPLLVYEDSKKVYDVFCLNNDIFKKVIAFHVGFGGSSDANWSLDEYEILIRTLLSTKKYQVVLTFGPDEKELYEEMQNRLADEDIVFYLSLEGIVYFAKLISNFSLFISTSTGTYHLASLVGCKTMTFFADTLFASPKRWKGVGDEALQNNYIIPQDKDKRKKLFSKVSSELLSM